MYSVTIMDILNIYNEYNKSSNIIQFTNENFSSFLFVISDNNKGIHTSNKLIM